MYLASKVLGHKDSCTLIAPAVITLWVNAVVPEALNPQPSAWKTASDSKMFIAAEDLTPACKVNKDAVFALKTAFLINGNLCSSV